MRLVNHNVESRSASPRTAEGARAVSKALGILEVFTPARPWWTISELAAARRIPASTVTRLVSALEGSGVLRREPGGFRYTIGHRALTWAGVARASTSLHVLVHPILESLRDETGESAAVYLRQGTARVCLDAVLSTQEVHFAVRLGDVGPLSAGGAASRCIAVFLPRDERLELGFPPRELAMLEQVPAFGGVVCTLSDRLKDAWALGAPIRDADGTVFAALLVGGPTSRFHSGLFAKYAPTVLDAARRLSLILGCPPDELGAPPPNFEGIPVFGSGFRRS